MTRHTGRAYAVKTTGRTVTFLAATSSLARDGLVINLQGMNLEPYKRNPILLVNHDYSSMPIGRTTRLDLTDQGLVADFEFDPEDETAMTVKSKIERGFLNAASIGWDSLTVQGNRVEESELLDISIVSVPGDSTALALARSAYQRSLSGHESDDLTEDDLQLISLALTLHQVERTQQEIAGAIPAGVARAVRSVVLGSAA